MRMYFGDGLIVLGLVLTAWGLDSSGSLNVRMTRLLVGGSLSTLIGLAMAAHRRPRALKTSFSEAGGSS